MKSNEPAVKIMLKNGGQIIGDFGELKYMEEISADEKDDLWGGIMWFFGKKAKKTKEEPKLERRIRLTGQTHTVEDEVLELAYDIDTAFKQVRSHYK